MKKTISILASIEEKISWIAVWRFFEYFALPVIPTLLILSGIIPSRYRLAVLGAILVYSVFVMWYRGWFTWETIGLKRETFSLKGLLHHVVWTSIAAVSLYGFAKLVHIPDPKWTPYQVALLVPICLILAIVQEFLFRPFMFKIIEDITEHPKVLSILYAANVGLFAFIHIIFPGAAYAVAITTVGGLLFTYLYKKFRNAPLVMAMHYVLEFEALVLGFFSSAILAPLEQLLKHA